MEQQQSHTQQASDPIRKRERVAPNLWLNRNGSYEDIRTNPGTGKQQLTTLKAKTLTEAKREQRALAVKVDQGEAVAPSRLKFEQVVEEWVELRRAQERAGERSERTLDRYECYLRKILPALGRRPIQSITPGLVIALVTNSDNGSSWNRSGMTIVLRRIFVHARTRGYIAASPFDRIDSSELPKPKNQQEARTLPREGLRLLFEKEPEAYRPILPTLGLTGLRIQEGLGLIWREIDFEAEVIRLRYQLSRATRERPARRVPLKAKGSKRDIRLEPELAKLLRKHKLASPFSGDGDYVFCTGKGTPLYYRNVAERDLSKAADAAGLNPPGVPRLSFHDLRHSYGSHLIRAGVDVVRVSRQMGHSRPSTTLDVYAHEIEETQHGDDLSVKLTAALGGLL
jgi:integrase